MLSRVNRIFPALDTTAHDELIPRQAPLCPKPVAALTEAARVLDSYVGATAAPKQVVELQPWVENRSVKVMIDGERTWQSQRLLEARFGCA